MTDTIHQYQTVDGSIEIENPEILEYLTEIVVTVRQKYKKFDYKLSDGTLKLIDGVLYFEISEVNTALLEKGYPLTLMINAINTDGKRLTSDKYTAAYVEDNLYKVVMGE